MQITAESLLNAKEFHKLELLFASNLKTSTDINLFQTYLKYIKQNQNTVNLLEVYDFIFKRLKHHWDVYFFIDDFVEYIRKSNLSDEEKTEKMRKIFHMFFLIPMHNLKELWNDYEDFENGLNKMTAKKVLGDIMPYYQKTHRLFTLYSTRFDYTGPLMQDKFVFEDLFEIIEIEGKNVTVYSSEFLFERICFIFRFFCQKFQREEAFFLFSEYLIINEKIDDAKEIVKRGINECDNSIFLCCYYGNVFDDDLFEEAINLLNKRSDIINEQNDTIDLVIINYLAAMLRKKGLEKFRNILKKYLGQEVGPCVFIYAAQAEYFTIQNKDLPFRIFTKALQKYPQSAILQYEFIYFLLNTGDLINARAFYEQFEKSEKIDCLMIDYESKFGSYDNIRKIVDKMEVKDRIMDTQLPSQASERRYQVFKNSCEYYNLKLHVDDILAPFVESLKVVKEFKYLYWDKSILIEILKIVGQ